MTVAEEVRKLFKSKIQKTSSDSPKGGQQVSVCYSDITLYSPDLDIRITVGYHRSQIKNYELARQLMDLAIDELIN